MTRPGLGHGNGPGDATLDLLVVGSGVAGLSPENEKRSPPKRRSKVGRYK